MQVFDFIAATITRKLKWTGRDENLIGLVKIHNELTENLDSEKDNTQPNSNMFLFDKNVLQYCILL